MGAGGVVGWRGSGGGDGLDAEEVTILAAAALFNCLLFPKAPELRLFYFFYLLEHNKALFGVYL